MPSKSPTPTSFAGFPPATIDFLRSLTANNEKPWFEAHRAGYEAFYVQPALAFVSAIGPRLQREVSDQIEFEARINGSLMRINRDIRFSKDKTPYKTHLDLWFWQGNRKGWDSPGMFIRLTPESLHLGAGMHHLMPPQLASYRKAVLDDVKGEALASLVEALEAAGLQVGASHGRKTVPKGSDPAHPRAPLLLYEGLVAMWNGDPPPELHSAAFVDWCLDRFKAASPINDWLQEALAV